MQIAVKTMIYWGIYLAKEIYWKHYKTLLRNIKQYLNKWKDMSYYSLGSLSIIKINSIHKRYKFHVMPHWAVSQSLHLKDSPGPHLQRMGTVLVKALCDSIMLPLPVEMIYLAPYHLKKLVLSGFVVVFLIKS